MAIRKWVQVDGRSDTSEQALADALAGIGKCRVDLEVSEHGGVSVLTLWLGDDRALRITGSYGINVSVLAPPAPAPAPPAGKGGGK